VPHGEAESNQARYILSQPSWNTQFNACAIFRVLTCQLVVICF